MCSDKAPPPEEQDCDEAPPPPAENLRTTVEEARRECGGHVDCSTCSLSENCPLHEISPYG